MRRLEGISGKGRYNTQNQMRGLCINNNDNKLFGQLIKLKVLQDGCSLVTKPDFLKDFFFYPVSQWEFILCPKTNQIQCI